MKQTRDFCPVVSRFMKMIHHYNLASKKDRNWMERGRDRDDVIFFKFRVDNAGHSYLIL